MAKSSYAHGLDISKSHQDSPMLGQHWMENEANVNGSSFKQSWKDQENDLEDIIKCILRYRKRLENSQKKKRNLRIDGPREQLCKEQATHRGLDVIFSTSNTN